MPIQYCGSKVLNTKRTTLRPFTTKDCESMFAYCSDPETTQFMRFSTHKSREETMSVLTSWEKEYEMGKFLNWAIVCHECGELIGSIGLAAIDEYHCLGECGYILRKDHWGKGLATECLACIIDFCFRIGFHRIECVHSVENPASGRVMQKVGMIKEGIKRSYYPTDHGYVDCVLYSILPSDCLHQVEQNIARTDINE